MARLLREQARALNDKWDVIKTVIKTVEIDDAVANADFKSSVRSLEHFFLVTQRDFSDGLKKSAAVVRSFQGCLDAAENQVNNFREFYDSLEQDTSCDDSETKA
jgi:hypothetical protein